MHPKPPSVAAAEKVPVGIESVSVDRLTRRRWLRLRTWIAAPRPKTGFVPVLASLFVLFIFIGYRNPHVTYNSDHTVTFATRAVSARVALILLIGIFAAIAAAAKAVRHFETDSAKRQSLLGSLTLPPWRTSRRPIFAAATVAGALMLASRLADHTLNNLLSTGPRGTYNDLPDIHAATVVSAAVVLLTAPIVEEVFYRGCLQSWMSRRIPSWLAILIATLGFTVPHGLGVHAYNSAQLTNVFVTGLAFAVLYQVTQSVLVSIVAHFTINATALVQALLHTAYAGIATVLALGVAGLLLSRGHQPRPPFGRSNTAPVQPPDDRFPGTCHR